ncbi:RNA recognition motif containing protein [Plasmodiophora brassicae]|uniref:Uncharacterized protein n=1 Tax=Plasmodiophora brassicae TaxID=37360 RepID=A0A0G4IJ19_PLABS|nr:hypothetical protein PBRA_003930 [Plasmodiophora brassicae]
MASSLLRPESNNPTIYITGLVPTVTADDLAEKFGQIGRIKTDKKTGDYKIVIYSDKATNEPKGDGTVTFEDPSAASAAVSWFNNTEFMGKTLKVELAEEKTYTPAPRSAPPPPSGRDQPRSGATGAPGEWDCPSCGNMNFAKRNECFRCHASRPAQRPGPASPSVQRQGGDDWTCIGCGNLNWARRNECNRCSAQKPTGTVERRTGRGGGYNDRQDSEPSDRDRQRGSYQRDRENDRGGRGGSDYGRSDYGRDRDDRGGSRGGYRRDRSRSPRR